MKKLHTLIIRSFVGPFSASFAIVLFILVLQFLARYVDDIFGKDVGGLVLLKVFGYASATLVTLALPLAILLSSLMTMGNLGERYELAAIKSAGVSLVRLVMPMTVVTLIITLFSMFFSFFMVPKSNMKLFSLLYDLSKVKPSFALSEGHFYDGLDGFVIYVAEKNRETDMLYKIKIYDHSEDTRRGNFKVLVADSAQMGKDDNNGKFLTMRLFSGVNHNEIPKKKGEPNKHSYSRSYFDTLEYHFPLTGFDIHHSTKLQLSPHRYMKNIFDLYAAVDSMEIKTDRSRTKLKNYMAPVINTDSSTIFGTPRRIPVPDSTASKKDNSKDKGANKSPPGKLQTYKGDLPKAKSDAKKIAKKEKPKPKDKKAKAATGYEIPVIPYTSDTSKVKNIWEFLPYNKQSDIVGRALNDARTMKNYAKFSYEKIQDDYAKMRRYEVEFYTRMLLPFACMAFLLIGAPLGAIIRKGGLGVPAIVSILFFILFYVLMIQGKKFAQDGIMDVALGVFLPLWVIFPLGFLLTWQAATDSRIMDLSQWKGFIKKIFKRSSQ